VPTFGPWTMLLLSFIAIMSSKLNNPMQLRKSKMLNVGCNFVWPPHDKIYMSMNHDENINTFKTHGRQNVKPNFNQHLSKDAWTSYIGNLIRDHFHFVIFHHLTFF
jgi:hypothetical protein